VKELSLTIEFHQGYTDAPYAKEFVDPLLGDYILSVSDVGDPLTAIDVDLYHKGTGNSVQPSSWAMDDYSMAVWFHLPTGHQVHIEVLSKQTIVSVWE
jgi:hypothetical protein